jgi:hypothetical protein
MAATQFFLPYDIAIKPTNVGAPGAKLYVYAPSTTTKRPVYATSALTTQLANPVTADGAGKFPAIYLDNAFTYKIVINDKNGAPLYQRDPYIPGMAPDSASLAPYQSAAAASAASVGTDAVTASTAASTASTAAAAAQAYLASLTALPTQGLGLTAASRASLGMLATTAPAILTESGREGVFVFDSANHSAHVTADARQGIYVARSSDATGAAGAWVRKYPGSINVKWFGAKGDGVTDDTAAIQAALNTINALGGGTLFFPRGTYIISAYLTLPKNITVKGEGKNATIIKATHAGGGGANLGENIRNGTAFYSNWTSNASTWVGIVIRDLSIWNSNAATSQGAAFYDNCGSGILIDNVETEGFKYSVIFDQTEIGDITDCNFNCTTPNGRCTWFVNGSILRAGNTAGFTNRVGVSRTQLNAGDTTVDLHVSDGGTEHYFGPGNNYNGGRYGLRLAGVGTFQINGGEFEVTGPQSIYCDYIAADGVTTVGGASGVVIGGVLDNAFVRGSHITWLGTVFTTGDAAYPLVSSADSTQALFNCTSQRSDGNFADSTGCSLIIDSLKIIKTNFGLTTWDLNGDYVLGRTRCTGTTNAGKILNDATRSFATGTWFELEAVGGPASFVADTGVTITGPLAATVVGQIIRAVKVAANTWYTQIVLQNPLTPPSLAATGDISTSGGKIGYATGAGGTATQATSKGTGVTLNKVTGDITMNAAALAAGAIVSFVQTNTTVVASDIIDVRHQSGGTLGAYGINAVAGAGTITYYVRNSTGGSLSEAIVLRYTARSAATT